MRPKGKATKARRRTELCLTCRALGVFITDAGRSKTGDVVVLLEGWRGGCSGMERSEGQDALVTDGPTSRRMRCVRTSDNSLERRLRRLIFRLGIGFSLRNEDLPGRPDVVMRGRHVALFVHGCFWHGHSACQKGRLRPVRNAEFWSEKIRGNMERDARVAAALRADGWKVIVVWECQFRDEASLARDLLETLRRG